MRRVTSACCQDKGPWFDDKETDGCCFLWTIQNFIYCLHKPGEWLDSPSFVFEDDATDAWHLRLYPRGTGACPEAHSKTIGFRLSIEDYADLPKTVDFTLSVQTASDTFKKLRDGEVVNDFTNFLFSGHSIFLTREELRGKDGLIFLNDDSLTLRCRIFKLNGQPLPPLHCHMRTIINVERTTSTWSLDKLRPNMSPDELITNLPTSLEIQSLIDVKLLSSRESFSGDGIKVEIKQVAKNKPCFFTCDLLLFELGGKVVHSVREEHLFGASEVLQVWTFPYAPPSKIFDFQNTYLRCKLAVSSGIKNDWVERIGIGETEILKHARSDWKLQKIFTDSWKEDLKRFYASGGFTDVTVRTQSKDFPVHKAILCARSTVFHAMFEQDMAESRTGIVDIDDIDADVIHKMLLFVYSDVVEDLDCDVASKLYSAADRYRITALRRICSDFLKKNLSVSNVCEVCVLASMYQDEELKSFVLDFFVEHAAEVMHSEKWETFMRHQASLASEIMHMMLLQNSWK